jgi:hypothetical protein
VKHGLSDVDGGGTTADWQSCQRRKWMRRWWCRHRGDGGMHIHCLSQRRMGRGTTLSDAEGLGNLYLLSPLKARK